MSSGLAFREGASPWDDPANTYYGTNLRTAALTETEIEVAPGREFHYNDWNLVLMGLVLERTTGMPLSTYMETRLWQPMGAEAAGSWSLDSETSGFEKVFVGINGRAIDFAKLGWLYLNKGRNSGNQIVPDEFIDEATRVDATTDPASFYQYYWWIDEDRNSYYAARRPLSVHLRRPCRRNGISTPQTRLRRHRRGRRRLGASCPCPATNPFVT